jgi:cobalamin biosynthesis protein CbiG
LKPTGGTIVSGLKTAASAAAEIGFADVADYRLYGLDRVNKVSSGEWIEADDDETAIEVAKEMMDGHDCELWKGKRLVARIPRRHAG